MELTEPRGDGGPRLVDDRAGYEPPARTGPQRVPEPPGRSLPVVDQKQLGELAEVLGRPARDGLDEVMGSRLGRCGNGNTQTGDGAAVGANEHRIGSGRSYGRGSGNGNA